MHAFDQPEVVAGAGTIGAELDEQAPGASTVIVAVGGGGLIAGIAAWFAGRVRIVGVEPHGCSALHAALAAGAPVDVEVGGIAADGLGAGRAGTIAFGFAQRFVDRVVLVDDDAIRDAQRRLWRQTRIVAEPGAAAALAGLTAGAYVAGPDEHIVVVVCGANADPASVR
jgi:threonine dehydratase